MKLKVKNMHIASGGALIAILNKDDAEILDLHALDRIKVKKNGKVETAIINISEGNKTIPKGYIGAFEELISSLKLKQNEPVSISFAKKPLSLEHIRKKLDGKTLSKKEIDQIVWDIVHNKLNSIELTYFVSACYARHLNSRETIQLTKAMASQGDFLHINDYPIIDKHCVGGVPGNRTTMILVPLITAAGYSFPKTSSRSITSPAGTADTMEVLCKVDFSLNEIKKIVKKVKSCVVWGGAVNLAPADDKIIQVERPLNIDAESQLLASIMAKKHAVSSTHLLIDIPVGKGTKFSTQKDADRIKKDFENIGKSLRKNICVMTSNGSQPIGNGVGPSLEARDVLWILMQHENRPIDLEKKCIEMASHIFEMIGHTDGRTLATELLKSGKAYKKMVEIIKAQGEKIIHPDDITLAKYKFIVKSPKSGRVKEINNQIISKIARIAGAPQNIEAGMYIEIHKGAKVKKNDVLFTLYAKNKEKLRYAISVLNQDHPYVIK